jgi:putative transposase
MPNPGSAALRRSRPQVSGLSFMVTTTVHGRQPALAAPDVADLVVDALQWLRRDGRIWLHGYSIMPDHVHIALTIRSPHTVSQVMHTLKSFTGNRINQALSRQGPFWIDGFHEHAIRTEEDLRSCLEYLQGNPARAGLVDRPDAHPYTRVRDASQADLDSW